MSKWLNVLQLTKIYIHQYKNTQNGRICIPFELVDELYKGILLSVKFSTDFVNVKKNDLELMKGYFEVTRRLSKNTNGDIIRDFGEVDSVEK